MRGFLIFLTASVAFLSTACKPVVETKQANPPASQPAPTTQPAPFAGGVSLFDGKTIGHWKITDFGGQGDVKIENDQLILAMGSSLTGITWQGPVPAKMNYEITLDAQRIDGSDFFCGLTFPVNDTFASLILGGWGGGVCGISSLDDEDAVRNETMTVQNFASGKWYHIRLRVVPSNFSAWIDDKQIVDVETKGKKISVRSEVEPSQPLGIATYQTTAGIKNIFLRKLPASEK